MRILDGALGGCNGLRRFGFLFMFGACIAVGGHFGAHRVTQPANTPGTAQKQTKKGVNLPPALRSAVQLAQQAEGGAAYKFSNDRQASAFAAENPQHGFSTQLSADGLSLRSPSQIAAGEAGLSMSLARFGCAESPAPADRVAPRQQGARVEYRRDAVTEWYVNGPHGLEHGFDVAKNPGCGGDLAFDLQLAQGAHATLKQEAGAAPRLRIEAGQTQYAYGGLYAYDADGRAVPAHLELFGERIRLRVEAAGARYPLVVDPVFVTWLQQQKFFAADPFSGAGFGASAALSADGRTAIVGASGAGGAYIFTRSGSTWTQQQKIVSPDPKMGDALSGSVALSADGNTALAGASGQSEAGTFSNGAACVFTRAGTTWSFQQKLLAPDRANNDLLGWSVALSSDGKTALVGALGDSDSAMGLSVHGSGYVFTLAGTTWSFQQKLLASDRASRDQLSWSAALSGDGNTAILGTYNESTAPTSQNGAAYVFTRTGVTWTQQQKLLAGDKSNNAGFGVAMDLSDDGNTALIGAHYDGGSGAAYAFTRAGVTWTQQQKLASSDLAAGDFFGFSVALSGDGNTAFIGATGAGNGAVYFFDRVGTTWTQEQKLVSLDGAANIFGNAVALSSDEKFAIIGANNEAYAFEPRDNNGQPCAVGATCVSGICADGVCCNTACGGSVKNDCQACSTAAGAPVNGTCGFLPSTTVCRTAAGVCDSAEMCTGSAAACPADAFKPNTTVCRAVADICDVEEMCTGSTAACPADSFLPDTTVCRPTAGICDIAEQCTGSGVACPSDTLLAAGTVCRAVADVCDVEEQCTGTDATCPGDQFQPSTLVCRPSVDQFDPQESCTGNSAPCPPDVNNAALPRNAGGGLGCAVSPLGAASQPAPWALSASLLLLSLSLLRRRSRTRQMNR